MRTLSLTLVCSIAASLFAKWLADRFLMAPIPIVGSFIGLSYTENPGVAFGVTFPPVLQALLIFVSLFFVTWAAFAAHGHSTRTDIGFGLILGGAGANLLDRLRDGLVTDFLAVRFFSVFNVADACITVGALLFAIDLLAKRRPGR